VVGTEFAAQFCAASNQAPACCGIAMTVMPNSKMKVAAK
jgi:hypothetical protein